MRTRIRLGPALLALTALIAGCNTVELHEKRVFLDRAMELGVTRAEAHFHQKLHYSTEGAAGGLGTTAGGGCGCY